MHNVDQHPILASFLGWILFGAFSVLFFKQHKKSHCVLVWELLGFIGGIVSAIWLIIMLYNIGWPG